MSIKSLWSLNKYFVVSIIGIFLFSCCLFAQNLVPNNSFEDTVSCPVNSGEIYKAKYWFNPTLGSPDYFNSCSPSVNVPNNYIGFQIAKTGNAYVGLYTYSLSNTDAREYIEIMLLSSLKSEKKYCIELNVSLADEIKYATNKIGAYLSADSLLMNSPYSFSIISHISETSIISDTSIWVKISGEYKSSGGEKFITIGNFFNDVNTNSINVNNNSTYPFAYYYIDDVAVYEIEELPFGLAGSDAVICADEIDSVDIGLPQIAGYQYVWKNAIGLTDTTAAQIKVKPQQTTSYILTVIDTTQKPYVCQPTVTDTVTIFVIEKPIADAGIDTTICEDSNVLIGSNGVIGYSYNWQPFAGLTDATVAQPTVNPAETTTYILTVNDTGNTCPAETDNITISVQNCIGSIVFLPSIFSPNGDSKNDIFRVRGNKIKEGNLSVYNRWGERIFDLQFTKDDLNDVTKWWDGKQNGKPLNTGVFVYFCRIVFEDGSAEVLNGNVTLVR